MKKKSTACAVLVFIFMLKAEIIRWWNSWEPLW